MSVAVYIGIGRTILCFGVNEERSKSVVFQPAWSVKSLTLERLPESACPQNRMSMAHAGETVA
jgi:hypothetical protein